MARNYSEVGSTRASFHGGSPAISAYNGYFSADEAGDSFDPVVSAQNQQVRQSDENLKRMQALQANADDVTQKSQEDSIKIGLANLLAKAKNMQIQAHLTLAKEAIEVSKSST